MNTLNGYSKSTLTDNYVLTAAGGHLAVGSRNGDVSNYVNFPTYAKLKQDGYIDSKYGQDGYGHPDDEYLKGICKWAIANYVNLGDVTLMGAIAPNSSGTCILHLYSSSGKHSETLLPRYCKGLYLALSGNLYLFGTTNYIWEYSRVAKSSEIPKVTDYYWADVKVSDTKKTDTSPTFAYPTSKYSLFTNGSDIIGYVGKGGSNNNLYFINYTNSDISISTDNTTTRGIYIKTGGNVGVGISDPKYKFHVSGLMYSSGGAKFTDVCINMKDDGSNSSGVIECFALTLYLNYYSSKNVVTNIGGGNLGIGTTNIPYKLTVKGSVGATSFVNTTSSDSYVLLGGGGTKLLGNSSGNIPLNNGTVNVNLNADLLDGYNKEAFKYVNDSNRVYTPNLSHHSGSVSATQYYKLSISNLNNVWTMFLAELSIKENYNDHWFGKVFIHFNKDASNKFSGGYIISLGKLSSNVKGYIINGTTLDIYISGSWNWPTVSVDKVLFGDSSTSYSSKELSLSVVNSLPSGTSALTKVNVLDSSNYSSYLGYIGTTAVQKSSGTLNLTGIGSITNTGNINTGGNIIFSPTAGATIGTSYSDTDANRYNRIKINAATGGILYYSGGWTSGDHVAHSFITKSDNTTRMVIMNSTGNVGIGTSSPGLKLLVEGHIALFESLDFTRELYNYITVPSNKGLLAFNIGAAGTANTKMLINNSGDVSIGNTDPKYKLHVSGSIYGSYGKFGGILINKGYNDNVGTDTIETATSGNMLYVNYYHNGGLNLCLGGGKVGIGTTSPQQKLHVNGSVAISTYLYMPDNSSKYHTTIDRSGNTILFGYGHGVAGYDVYYTGKNVHLNAAGGWATNYNLTLLANGNVGIGTYSPTLKLEVTLTVKAARFMSSNVMIECDSTGASGGCGSEINNFATHLYLLHHSANNVYLASGGGNVGIGVTTADTKLHVNGTILNSGTIISNDYRQVYNCGSYAKATSSVTGAIVILLPITSSQYDMVNVEISVYEYNSLAASKIIVGGHPWQGTWYNYSCSIIGSYSRGVRLGIYGGKYCIILGTSSTVWSYPGVFVTHIGTIYDNHKTSYLNKCVLSLVTSESGFSALVTPTNVLNATNLAWGNITGKPSTYTPSSHNHNYIISPYYYSTNVMTNSITADTLFGTDANINKLSCGFMENHPTWSGYADLLYWTGYCKYGATLLATEYNAVKPRVTIRKYNLSRGGWGDWTEFITSANIADLAVYYVKDKSNGNKITFHYSDSGLSSNPSWLAAWNGYDLTYVSPSVLSVNYAASAGSVAWSNVSGRPDMNKYVPKNFNNIAYSDVTAKYVGSSTPTYFRIIFPDRVLSMWNMVNIEIFVRLSYDSEYGGKILICTHNNSGNTWNPFRASTHGPLTTSIKVYGSGGKYLYIGGCGAYSTISIDKILIGDTATNYDISDISIDYVTSLPSTYQTATMYYDINSLNIGSQSVNYANSAGSVAWGNITGKPGSFTPASHTHTYIESKANYTFTSSTLPNSFDWGVSAGFVADTSGFGSYGSVLTVRTYTGGGGTLQLYAPYSNTYGGSRLKARFGNYDSNTGNSWTSLKELAWLGDIPSVGNGTVTIKLNGTTKGTFTMNQSGNTTIALTDTLPTSTFSSLFINTGDPTLKIYSGKITDARSDGNICLQTCIDGTDGQTHSYAPNYQARENLVLQPRGGLVYIGTNPDGGNTSYKLYVNGAIYGTSFAGNVAWGNITGKPSSFTPASHSHSNYAVLGTYNNLTHSGNEFTFASAAFSGEMWINYRTASGSTDGNITKYYFGNGKAGYLAYISSGYFSGTAAAANSVAWANVTGKPSIPSVGNGTVTIKQAGTTKGSFTMNQSGNTTIELTDNNTTYSFAPKGSATQGIYLAGTNTFAAMTYSLKATVNAGTSNKLAYYSGANAISAYTSTRGDYYKPIYLSGGVPIECYGRSIGTVTWGTNCSGYIQVKLFGPIVILQGYFTKINVNQTSSTNYVFKLPTGTPSPSTTVGITLSLDDGYENDRNTIIMISGQYGYCNTGYNSFNPNGWTYYFSACYMA